MIGSEGPALEIRRSDLAPFRSWKKLLAEPQLVPYRVSALCALLAPTAQDLEHHGPHTFRWIMVYANPAAAEALRDDAVTRFPPGAILAKEKLSRTKPDKVEGVAFMVKHEAGQFGSSGGWEFVYLPSDGAKPSYETCIACHKSGGRKDYVFGSYGAADPR